METTLTFLRDLAANNERPYFEENRKRYLAAKNEVEALAQDLIFRLSEFAELGNLSAKECMFRIFRDVRFSKNKAPYKTNMGAFIASGGRRSGKAGYYLHIEPGNSFLAGGQYSPSKDQLANIRAHLAEDAQPLRDIISDPAFIKTFGTLNGAQVKTAPRGFKKDHPNIDMLRYKQFTAWHNVPQAKVNSADFLDHAVEVFRTMHPLVAYLNGIQDTVL